MKGAVCLLVEPAGKRWRGRVAIDGKIIADIQDDHASRSRTLADLLDVLLANRVEIDDCCIDA